MRRLQETGFLRQYLTQTQQLLKNPVSQLHPKPQQKSLHLSYNQNHPLHPYKPAMSTGPPDNKSTTANTSSKPSSVAGMDYINLRNLLAAKKWREADEETARVMLKVAGREKEGWLDSESIEKFPCEDLRTIDQLWVKYSNGRFGFSVQKRIYQSLMGTSTHDKKVWKNFGDKVGWRKNNKWLYYKDLTFSDKKAVQAHLPAAWGVGFGEWRVRWEVGMCGVGISWWGGECLFSRVETCRL